MSCVYIISDGTDIKIGKSNDPEARLSILQTANKYELTIIRLIKCETEQQAYIIEKGLHRLYNSYCIRNEWFNGIILKDIQKYTDNELFYLFSPTNIHNNKLITKKSIKAKEIIKKYNKDFLGELDDTHTRALAKISRNTYYKYKKELKMEQMEPFL